MRGMKRRLGGRSLVIFHLVLSCSLILATLANQGQSRGESEEVVVFIHGPEMLQTNTTAEYTIEITGGPAEEGGNWSFEASLEGEESVGNVEPNNGTSSENIFSINITTPKEEKIIKLVVNGSSFNETNSDFAVKDKEIQVFEPIPVNISAVIRNPSKMDVKGAVVSFYVSDKDGAFTLIGNETVDVAANGTTRVYKVWIASKIDEGEHKVEVRINEDGELLEFDNGDNVMRKTIYVGERPSREMQPIMIFNNPGLVLLIEILAILFVIAAFMMRRKTVRGRGYYSTTRTNIMYFQGIFTVFLSIPVFAVSQIISENPDVFDDPNLPIARLIDGIFIFVMGFATILLTWDRTRKKR